MLKPRTQLAIQIITQLSEDKKIPNKDLAESLGVSLSHVESIGAQLRRAGFIKAERGPGGGAMLAKPLAKISLHKVHVAVYPDVRQPFEELIQSATALDMQTFKTHLECAA